MESEITADSCFSKSIILKWNLNSYVHKHLLLIIPSCWLSVEQGTIFGFVAPMLAIIFVRILMRFELQ
jgi:hypothetical protein